LVQTFYETDLQLAESELGPDAVENEVAELFAALKIPKGRGMQLGELLSSFGKDRLGHSKLPLPCRTGLRQLGAALGGQNHDEMASSEAIHLF